MRRILDAAREHAGVEPRRLIWVDAASVFGGTLVPVLGFVNVYPFVFSYVADHFQYLACLGVIVFFTAAATRWFASAPWPRWSGPAVAAEGRAPAAGGTVGVRVRRQ